MMDKNLYIISGCNGAGKTTASYTVLPEILQCKEFVNADEIAKGLSPFNPESVAIEAGSPELAIQRVSERVSKGGHNIPLDVIQRRYVAGIRNLFKFFMEEVDLWMIYDNSHNPRTFIAKGGIMTDKKIFSETIYNKIKAYVR
mgnify:CR=1 FL=1